MSPGPTFDRVYPALKEQLMSGRFAPGDHLEPAAIGKDLNSSITPVRDALHRLVGERLVEAPRHNGFTVPSPTEAELRELYAWNSELLNLALRGLPTRPHGAGRELSSQPVSAADLESWSTADLFRAIARRQGNPELEAAVESLSERLAPLRLAERHVFADFDDELLKLKSLVAGADANVLRREFVAYHRRRQKGVPDLLLGWRHLAQAAETTMK